MDHSHADKELPKALHAHRVIADNSDDIGLFNHRFRGAGGNERRGRSEGDCRLWFEDVHECTRFLDLTSMGNERA